MIRTDLGPNCLSWLSAEDTCKQKVMYYAYCSSLNILAYLFFANAEDNSTLLSNKYIYSSDSLRR